MSARRAPRGQKRAVKVKQRQKRVAQESRRLRERDEAEARELDEAERSAAEILGYRVTADNEHEFTDEEVEEFDDLAEQLLQDRGAIDREFDALVELVADGLQVAVQETLDRRSPEPAREQVAKILATDEEVVPEGENPPGRSAAFLTLVEWLGQAREVAVDPPPAESAVGWIEQALGAEPAAAARTIRGFLVGNDDSMEAAGEPAEDLGDDLLPAMIWLVAGAVATHGGGDAGWLRRTGRADGTVGATG